MTTNYRYNVSYKNETGQNVLLADGREVLAIGDKSIKDFEKECSKKYPGWSSDLGGTPWGIIEIVAPGETVSHTFTGTHGWKPPVFDSDGLECLFAS